MKFSVLLSVYHKENPLFLKQSLDSILEQSLSPDEIVLVKDGPLTPALEEVINSYQVENSILKIVSLEKNEGLGKALNIGLTECSYDIVARMDTDDIAKRNRFEEQMRIFQESPEIDVVSAWIDEFEDNISNVVSTKKLPKTHSQIYQYAKKRNPVNHPVVMFKKKSVLEAGGYLHFPLFEDYYLWVRMLLNGAVFYNIQQSLLYFRFTEEMFKRRGGWAYALNEYKLQKEFRTKGFLSESEFLFNLITHFPPRILPNFLRVMIYKQILRR